MIKLQRLIFVLFGIIGPIATGALHLFVHFKELVILKVEVMLQNEITIMGDQVLLSNTWGLMSFMMGAAFIVIGLLNLVTYIAHGQGQRIPAGYFLVMMIYGACVVYVGLKFDGAMQLYGGVVVLVALTLGLVLSLRR
jgi:hypothetical protein